NGSQPTSGKFIKETSILGIKQVFASYNNRHSSLEYMKPVEFEQKEIKQSPLTRTPNSPLFCS
ncbi:MAG TPA: hypothetical protein PK303_08235, partial [bacterium]|nr:hypothetical protein [bacterium]HPP09091.1 hypothetical protein [bacterium]